MEKSDVDFVNPMFLWISPIEDKVEGRRKLISNSLSPRNPPDSPLLKAKTAIQRRFSAGGSTNDTINKRGT